MKRQRLKQLTLPFDFWEEEKREEEKRRQAQREKLLHFENPKNDNEYLLECQWKYRHGDDAELVKMYNRSRLICLKFINAISNKNRHVRALTLEQKRIKADDAATYVIEQFIKRPDFAINKNFPGYLFLRVAHELFYFREVDKIVDFVDIDRFFREGECLEINEEGTPERCGREIVHYTFKDESESDEDQEQKELRQFCNWKRKRTEGK